MTNFKFYLLVLLPGITSNFEMLKQHLFYKIFLNFRIIWKGHRSFGLFRQYQGWYFMGHSNYLSLTGHVVTNLKGANTEIMTKRIKLVE